MPKCLVYGGAKCGMMTPHVRCGPGVPYEVALVMCRLLHVILRWNTHYGKPVGHAICDYNI